MSSEPTERRWSLRGRLIRLFAAGGAAAWLVGSALVLGLAEREDDGDWDVALERSAQIVLRLASNDYAADGNLGGMQGRLPLISPGTMIQIRDAQGRLLLKTADAPDTSLVGADAGFHDVSLANGKWRVAVFRDAPTGLVVQLADSEKRRTGEFIQLGLALMVPIVVGLPILMLGAWLLASPVVKPLRRAARQVAERGHSDLSPIRSGELPEEVQPLVTAFNGQLQRLGEAWDEERRFAAGVAHELRTPLAGIRLNLQRLRQEFTVATARARLDVLIGAVDRAGRVIEQLLTLTGLERNLARERARENLDPHRIIEETLTEFAARTAERAIRFDVETDMVSLRAPAQAFYLVLRNFVENAVRHSPDGGAIRIGAGRDREHWWLQVEDAGSGLEPAPPALEPRPVENLQIGLSLVRKIAELLDGRLESGRSERLGGARFRFVAPLAAEETGAAVSG